MEDQMANGMFDSVNESSKWKTQLRLEKTIPFTKSAGNIEDM